MLALLVSCNNETVYHKFVNIEGGEWTKQNKFTFEAGSFDSDIPAKTKTVDTLTYVFSGRQGDKEARKPDGPAFFQVSMPLKTLSLHKGDSLSVTLRHNMKCMALPGVVDVGIKLKNRI